jgi:protein SCO1/2
VASALILTLVVGVAGCQEAQSFNGNVVEPPRPAPELPGTNWDGEPFRLSERRGKVTVLFFGYTFCPDICPMTLTKMRRVEEGLGDRADDLEVVFVSVDPHRDGVEKLSGYVPNFDQSFYGVHLTFDELERVKEDFGITVQYSQPKDGPGSDSYYYVDHTGTYFVLDRQGRIRLEYPPTATPEQMIPDIETLIAAG